MKRLTKLIIIISFANSAIGQIPIITTPQSATININGYQPSLNQKVDPLQYLQQQDQLNIQQQNQQIIHQMQTNEQQKRLSQNQVYQDLKEENNSNGISYELPSFSDYPETEYYKQAFQSLADMLSGKQPMNLKKAVFTVENAYYENRLNYEQFDKKIKEYTDFCKLKMKVDGLNKNNPLAVNNMIFKFMTDTIKISKINEQTITHLPMNYDFNDYDGTNDWSKMFVSKLMLTNSGQCHSLPLLYLILCNELGSNSNAYLSFSPRHSFVRIKDKIGNLYNVELTNKHIVSDAYVTGSGFVKADALKNKIYMDTLGIKKQIANCFIDLANGYIHKFGYDDFMLQCSDTALKYFPKDIYAIQTKANYYTYLTHHVGKQLPRVKSQEEMEQVLAKFPKAKEIINKRNEMYEIIDRLGYQDMPAEAMKIG
jgi:hypothetical protein